MSNYIIKAEALLDIEDIWLHTYTNWSQEQADRYYNLIINEIKYISKNFDYGVDANHIRKGYRYTKIKSHLIFYRKNVEGIVEIVRVLHERMNIEDRL